MNKISLAYFGTPDFSADFLEKLITDQSIKRLVEVKLVVTQPDRPVGRKQTITSTPVKFIAKKYGLKCLEIKNWDLIRNLKLEIRNLDLVLVYAFGKIIPKEILSLPKIGFWNIHPSLLPKYRGPSPITQPLINGDAKTGVTIIKMDEEIDHGPIIAQEELKINPTDKRPDLEKKLTELGFKMFTNIIKGSISCFSPASPRGTQAIGSKQIFSPFIQQNHTQATYTKLLKKDDGFIPFENLKLKIENSPEKLFNLFRGLYPWPGLWTLITPPGCNAAQQKRLKIIDMQLINDKPMIKKVQLEGKKPVDFATFNQAYRVF